MRNAGCGTWNSKKRRMLWSLKLARISLNLLNYPISLTGNDGRLPTRNQGGRSKVQCPKSNVHPASVRSFHRRRAMADRMTDKKSPDPGRGADSDRPAGRRTKRPRWSLSFRFQIFKELPRSAIATRRCPPPLCCGATTWGSSPVHGQRNSEGVIWQGEVFLLNRTKRSAGHLFQNVST